MGLKAMHKYYDVLTLLRHILRRNNVASLVYFLKYFYGFGLFFKLILTLNKKRLIP